MIKAVASETIVLHRLLVKSCFRKLLALACFLAVAPAAFSQGAPGGPIPVSVIEVRPTSVPSTLEVTGQAEGAKETEVRARVNGILLKRLFVEGAPVQRGQPLFQIDPVPFQNALDEAQARAKQTEREAARLKKLFSQQAVSRKEYDDATSVNEIAQALITSTGDAGWLTSIYQVDPIWVRFGLSSADAAQLPAGRLDAPIDAPVQLLLGNGQIYDQQGRLNFRSVFIDPKLGTQQLRAEFPNPQRAILPGQFLRVRITKGSLDNVFLVPQRAVIQNDRGYMVWTVGSDSYPNPSEDG
ncbi:MAG: biotin/lipoyl-binding protein [Burkholderiales bacterium]|nr:biotin/lipoyl-binding protein [Burkholderiales bacterium]